MDAQTIASRVWQSYQRCTENYTFLQDFYQRFIASSPLVADRFSNTDMDHQILMLRASLELMLGGAQELDHVEGLERIAQLHSRQDRDIPPALYDLWLDSLMQTVRSYDPDCDDRLEFEWRQLLEQGIAAMKAGY